MTVRLLANLFAGCLVIFGYGCLRLRAEHTPKVLSFLRNDRLGIWIFSIAHGWFFIHLIQLEEQDCGTLKPVIIGIFWFAFIGCIFYWKDFLLVRGVALLLILTAHQALAVSYMETNRVCPYLAIGWYALILLALGFGINPYWVRDLLPSLFSHHRLALKIIASIHVFYGTLLIILSYA